MKDDTVKLAVPAHAGAAAHAGAGAHRVGAGRHHVGQLHVSRNPATSPGHNSKRAFDIVVAALLLLCLVGVFAIIALLIKLDSPGPVFYRVRRVGYRGRPLRMLKFRKMRDDARGGPLTLDRDPRLTRIGGVLTRARLDELPQLWDVLRGRMSMIGPRPEDPGFVALHDIEYDEILGVRPGITGLSQIAYKAESEIVDSDRPVEDYISRILPQKLTLDRLYARTASLTLDLRILWWTFVTVGLRHPVSVNRVNAAMNLRRRRPALPPARAPEPELPESALPVEA
jgi:lipopolysaccharide/colanic/teichoic acid biosynthesis glycosyltransferase